MARTLALLSVRCVEVRDRRSSIVLSSRSSTIVRLSRPLSRAMWTAATMPSQRLCVRGHLVGPDHAPPMSTPAAVRHVVFDNR
jgi:hypothetical protein